MKRIIFAICLAAAAPTVTGCSTISAVVGAPHSQGGVKAFIAAEYALDTAVLAVEQAVDAGLLKGEAAANVAKLIRTAVVIDRTARNLYAVGDVRGGDAQVAALVAIIAQVNGLVSEAHSNR